MQKTCTRCGVTKSLADFGNSKVTKDGKPSHCRSCDCARVMAYRAAHPDKVRSTTKASLDKTREARNARRRERRAADPDATKAQRKLDYARYRERELLAMRNWKENNREHMRQHARAKYWADPVRARVEMMTYRNANAARVRLWRMSRLATVRKATPQWADFSQIELAYEAADMLMQVTGDWYEVDHIVPLRGAIGKMPVVCGLHVAHNLQVITRSENRTKSNRIWPNMPGI